MFINQHGNLVAWVGQGDGLRLVAAAQGQVVTDEKVNAYVFSS